MGNKLRRSGRASGGVAGFFRSLEHLFQEGVEGPLRRVFRTQLQPVEVAKAAAGALEQSQAISLSGPRVANRYQIRLHPTDYARFAAYRFALARDVESYLDAHARRLGAQPVDAWVVELLQDQAVPLGRVEVSANAADVLAGQSPGGSESDYTERLQAIRPEPILERGVLLLDGEERALSSPVTSLGRALDNHIVLDDNRVSRYHAQIHERSGQYRVRDLASTNGTFVSGRRIEEEILAPGDELSLGGVLLRFELRPG